MKKHLFVFIFGFAQVAIAQQANNIGQWLKKAADFSALGDYEAAVSQYTLAQQHLSPNELYWDIAWKKAWAYTELQKRKEAIEELKNSIKLANKRRILLSDSALLKHHSLLYQNYKLSLQNDTAAVYEVLCERVLAKNKQLYRLPNAYYYFRIRGYMEDMVGNFHLSESYFKQASRLIALLPAIEKHSGYNALGIHHQLLNDFSKARAYFLLANRYTTNERFKAYYLINAAATTPEKEIIEMKRYVQQAQLYYRQYRTKVKAFSDKKIEYDLSLRRAIVARLKNQHPDAENLLQKCIEICQKDFGGRTPWMLMTIMLERSRNAEQQKDNQKALQMAHQAIQAIHFNFKNPDVFSSPPKNGAFVDRFLFEALVRKAQIAQKIYAYTHQKRYLALASITFQLASEIAHKVRIGYEGESSKFFFNNQVRPFFESAVDNLYRLNPQLSFALQEQSKATLLLDAQLRAQARSKLIPDSIRKREDNLDRDLTALYRTSLTFSAESQKDSMATIIAQKNIEIQKFKQRINRLYPKYFEAKYQYTSPAINSIQAQLLDTNTVLISYFFSTSFLYSFVITNDTTVIHQQAIDSTFIKTLTEMRSILATSPQSKVYNGQFLAEALYRWLIAPIAPFFNDRKRLLIVRDAELNYLPFEVLAAKSDDYLLKKYVISYAYSVGLLMNKPSQNNTNDRLAIAPFAGNIPQKTAFRSAPLVPLPASEREVRQVGGDVYLEKEATKKRFLEQYREHGIIHFATHALTDDKDPMRSFVAFYPDGQEYRLFTNELYDLDLKEAQLVVLSACETGTGKLQRGEGVMSLARAFTYAGAMSVATTLWNANDEATAYISTQFHEYINDGLPLDEALQRAKLDFLQSEFARRYNHPYYWANMVLIGRTEPIETGNALWWMILGAVFVLALTVWWVKKIR